MTRRDLIRHLEGHGGVLLREGGSHSVYVNRAAQKTSTVPRHREINALSAEQFTQSDRTARGGSRPLVQSGAGG